MPRNEALQGIREMDFECLFELSEQGVLTLQARRAYYRRQEEISWVNFQGGTDGFRTK